MSSKNKRKRGSSDGVAASEEVNQMIKDPRFSSAHTDPRFRTVPRRQTKVAIDSRFQSVLTDKASAPVDKRGKRMRKGRGKDSLKEFYRIDEDEDEDEEETKKEKKDNENEDESEGEKEIMDEGKSEESEEEESEKKLGLKLVEESESDEEAESGEEEEDTDEDDEASYEDDGPEIPEEKIATIEKETHRLAIVGMDWRHVSAKDLYALLNSLLPKDGRLLSVAVYPSEFGLERMKEEEIHGPAIEGLRKKEDDDDEEEDEDVINEKLRDYEKSRLRYYYGVAECDSSATADYLYKSCDGIELERSSNKLDLRFIPDSMEFVHPPRDIATEAPADYVGLDFLSRALQMSNVNLSWDEDEPHRVKTLNQKFKPHQLAELELKEYLASDDDSESEEDDNQGINLRKEKYRALFESEGVNSDKDNEEENDQDMEVTFNTGLEDLSRKQLEKKEKKSETVWESVQRRVREKKRAKKNKQNDDSSSPDDDDSDDDKVVKDDGDDDFFMKQPPLEKKKDKKKKKKKKKDKEEEVAAAEERSRAELELLLADENAGDGNALKGYNIKRKGKKESKEIAEEKIPSANLDDPRFSALFSDPHYALDPTDPNFKRSATYVRQVAQKQKKDPQRHEEVTATEETEAEPELKPDGKKERHEMNSVIKSVQMKIKGSEMKNAGNAAAASSAMAQRVKKKAKAYSNK
uniref:Pre-rRNA-processing protein esf1 n=1 Tax=Noccaea caerulescens TaxID=107243 RepID=A0A1J3F548_NOCCA